MSDPLYLQYGIYPRPPDPIIVGFMREFEQRQRERERTSRRIGDALRLKEHAQRTAALDEIMREENWVVPA